VGWNGLGGRGVAPGSSLKGFNYLESQSLMNWTSTFGGEAYSADIDIFNFSAGSYIRAFSVAHSVQQTTFDTTLPNLRSGKGAILVKSAGNNYDSDANFFDSVGGRCGNAIGLGLSCHDANLDYNHVYPTVIVVGALAADGKKKQLL
jgi:hypothetical protein